MDGGFGNERFCISKSHDVWLWDFTRSLFRLNSSRSLTLLPDSVFLVSLLN